jgi:hypothetical protein
MSGRVNARDTVARETPAASATWLIVGASRRLPSSSINIPVRADLSGLLRLPRFSRVDPSILRS